MDNVHSTSLGGHVQSGRLGLLEFAKFDCDFLLDALVDSIDNKPLPAFVPSSTFSSSLSPSFSSSCLLLIMDGSSDCHSSPPETKAEVNLEMPITRRLR